MWRLENGKARKGGILGGGDCRDRGQNRVL